MKKLLTILSFVEVMLGAVNANASTVATTVAEGYADWTGLSPQNKVKGRSLSSSDFRHHITIVAVVNAGVREAEVKKLGDDLRLLGGLTSFASAPEWATQWDIVEEIPRERLVVVLLRGKCTQKEIMQACESREGEAGTNAATSWKLPIFSFYTNVEMVNGPDFEGKLPFVYVMGPSGTEPIWRGEYKKGSWTAIKGVVDKTKKTLGAWTPLTGIVEPQFFAKEKADLLAEKSTKGVLAVLQKGIGSSDAARSKEAQIMYDAVCQYRTDLLYRIGEELSSAPARAYADLQRFLRQFPQDKKQVELFQERLKGDKAVQVVGKIMERYIVWNRLDFTFKNVTEAKKAIKQTTTWKKTLEKLSEDRAKPALAGEAALLLAQIDGLPDMLMSKVAEAN